MKIALTGTPGTGKSTVADILSPYIKVVHVNDLIKGGYNTGADEERGGALIADLDRLSEYVTSLDGDVLLEGHVSHLLPADMVIVLRASPSALKERLSVRGYADGKIRENVEAEALDIILVESLDANENVYEINTTNMTAMEVRDAVLEIMRGTDRFKPGSVDFSEEVFL
jgi:adenylate kinase